MIHHSPAPNQALRAKKLVPQCLIVFSLMLIFLFPASTHAFQQLQLTIEGELENAPLDVLGLQNGDPFNFTILFDPAIQTPGNIIGVDSVEAQLGSLNFVGMSFPDFAVNEFLFGATSSSFSFIGAGLTETSQNDLSLGPITAVPLFFSVEAADIGPDPNLFPANLSTADVNSFNSGILGLFDGNGVVADVSINFTGLSVTAVPEPSSALVLTLATLVLTKRRRC